MPYHIVTLTFVSSPVTEEKFHINTLNEFKNTQMIHINSEKIDFENNQQNALAGIKLKDTSDCWQCLGD